MFQLERSEDTGTEEAASRSSSNATSFTRCCEDSAPGPSPPPLPAILSLQSHVVRSCVGGAAFTFPLQRQGFQVGCIYTTQFVDMYVHEGTVLSPHALRTLLEGVSPTPASLRRMHEKDDNFLGSGHADNGGAAEHDRQPQVTSTRMHSAAEETKSSDAATPQSTEGNKRALRGWSTRPHDYIASGFIGSRPLISEFSRWLSSLRDLYARENCTCPLYLCDPVLGDGGHVYVPRECLPLYARLLLPLSDIITPNHWEAMWLAGYARQSAANPSTSPDSMREGEPFKEGIAPEHAKVPAAENAGTGWQPFTNSGDQGGVQLAGEPRTISDALLLVNQLHALGPEIVIITSVELPDETGALIHDRTDEPSNRVSEPESSGSSSYLYLVASRQARKSPRCTPSCWSPAGVRKLRCRGRTQNVDPAGSASTSPVSGAFDAHQPNTKCGYQDEQQADPGRRVSRSNMQSCTPLGASQSKVSASFRKPLEGSPLTELAPKSPNLGEDEEQETGEDRVAEKEEDDVVYVVRFPKLETSLCGTGDVWAALFLAAFHKSRFCLRTAVENALSGTQAALRHTLDLHGRASECIDVVGSCVAMDAAPVHRAVRIQRPWTTAFPSA